MKVCTKYTRHKITGTVISTFLFFSVAAIVNNLFPASTSAMAQLYRLSITEKRLDFELANPHPNIKLQKTDSLYSPHLQLLQKDSTPVKKHKRYLGRIASQAC